MNLATMIAHASDTQSVGMRMRVHNLPITIEHPRGTVRKLHDDKGNVVFKKHMAHHYGYFNKTKGRDGDEVDVIVGPVKDALEVYIIDMKDMGPVVSEREDEDKVMVYFPSADAAKAAFIQMYAPSFYGGMTSLPVDTFKKRLATAQIPYNRNKITAKAFVRQMVAYDSKTMRPIPQMGVLGSKTGVCPHCGSKKYALMPTDFETAKCSDCGKNWQVEP